MVCVEHDVIETFAGHKLFKELEELVPMTSSSMFIRQPEFVEFDETSFSTQKLLQCVRVFLEPSFTFPVFLSIRLMPDGVAYNFPVFSPNDELRWVLDYDIDQVLKRPIIAVPGVVILEFLRMAAHDKLHGTALEHWIVRFPFYHFVCVGLLVRASEFEP